jgi:hypothetical protein
MAITKYTDISSYVNTIYERSLLVVRERNIMANLVTNYSAQGWMVRTFSTRPEVTPETVADGVDYTNPTSFGKSTIGSLTPAEKIAQIILTDQNVETDPDGARNQASQELGEAIAKLIDTDLAGDFSSFSTDVGAGAGSSATIATFAAGMSRLRNASAPSPINAVVHPYHWHDIWVELGQPAKKYVLLGDVANEALQEFYVGALMGMRWFTNANIAVDASDDAVSGIFNARALALDTRRAYRLEPERDASLRAYELNATVGYAHGLGDRPAFGMAYTADAAAP